MRYSFHRFFHRGAVLMPFLVGLALVVSACAGTGPSSAPPPLPTLAPRPGAEGTIVAVIAERLPVVTPTPRATQTPAEQEKERELRLAISPVPTVWDPRLIALRTQQVLAQMLGTSVDDVPLVGYRSSVDPALMTCLDRLQGDVPTFGEGEALVFVHQGVSLYVISSSDTLWVCRQEEEGMQEMTLEQAQEAAVTDLARRLGIDPRQVQVVSAEAVTWSDASLGCPQPDMTYGQVLTPGYRIVLKVAETRYNYHGSLSRVFLCESSP